MEYSVDFSIYNLDVVKKAISDYKEVANIVLWKNNTITINGEFTEEENNHIFNEFMNYVLSIVNY